MAIQNINIGNRVNDGLGDDLRTAFQKVNSNFIDLSNELTITASNINPAGAGIFKQKTGGNLEFKSLLAGRKIYLDEEDDAVRINSSQPDSFKSIVTNNGTIVASNETNPTTLDITIQGSPTFTAPVIGQSGRNIKVVKTSDTVISIDTTVDIKNILTVLDFGPLNNNYDNPLQLVLSTSNIDFGTITNPGNISVDLGGI